MRRSSIGVLGVLVLAVALTGCGGGKSSSEGKSSAGESGASSSSASTSASTTSAGGGGPTVLTAKSNATFGSILAAGPKKLTVYMFKADHGKISACYGACASVWVPVAVSGAPKLEGGASSAMVGTISRSDGTKQLTYAGRPLYYYTPDTNESSITGQGVTSFGAPWYMMAPSGKVITKP